MADEKRRYKRMAISTSVQMDLIDENGTKRRVDIELLNLSRSGMGFVSDEVLEMGSFYNAEIMTWRGDRIKTVVEIVRAQPYEGTTWYGGSFIGMTDADQLKIQIYELTSES